MEKSHRFRPCATASDRQAAVSLLLACREAETTDRFLPFHLSRALTPGSYLAPAELDIDRDSRIWLDAGDRPTAVALVALSKWGLLFYVHPQQEKALYDDIIAWASARAAEIAHERGEGVALACTKIRRDNPDLGKLLETSGFERTDPPALRMIRPLDEALPSTPIPAGYSIVHGPHDPETYAGMANDVSGNNSMTAENYRSRTLATEYVGELNLAAVHDDGSYAAYCWCAFDKTEPKWNGLKEGWTDPIGTREEHRRKGLARALIVEALHRLRRHGIDAAILSTDSGNAAAVSLYESLGYRELYKLDSYVKSFFPGEIQP